MAGCDCQHSLDRDPCFGTFAPSLRSTARAKAPLTATATGPRVRPSAALEDPSAHRAFNDVTMSGNHAAALRFSFPTDSPF